MLQENLIKIYERSFKENREMTALSDYFKNETYSYYQMAREIAKLHLLFDECGIKRGDKIALIGRNNPRWCIAYLATITYGAVIVPILQEFPANDVNHIIHHSESRLLFCGDTFWDVIEEDRIPMTKAAISLTDFTCIYERKGESVKKFQHNIIKHYRTKFPKGFSVDHIKYSDIPNDSLALLNYTSGTTGFSKGVMLSINNLTGNICYGIEQQIFLKGSRVLSFLPLAHAYGCAFDMLLPLATGAHVTLLGRIPSPKVLLEAMSVVRPHMVCCVPLVLEKVCRKQIFPSLGTGFMRIALRLPLIDKAIYSTIRKKLIEAFGGETEQFMVGGAPLNRDIEEFLIKIKFPFTVGYGMTECGPLISYAYWSKYKPTSVGAVLEGYMEARIDSDDPEHKAGEIIVRGENVMMGYYKNPETTAAVLDKDGWLHTGDIGTMDPDGTLYIRGRNKTMILGANGQNIYPEEVESKLNNLYCVMESLVLERGGQLIALVVPDYEQADVDNILHSSLPEVMERNLRELNDMVAPYERINEIRLYPTEFEKTPKRSIKRFLYSV